MPGTTKGAVLRKRLDADATVAREMRATGELPRITAAQIEAWGEAEFEARTWNGWSRDVCSVCHEALSDNGACQCVDSRSDVGLAIVRRQALLAELGLS